MALNKELLDILACPNCRGEGSILSHPCAKCMGRGVMRETRELKVRIPAGVDSGSRLRLRGERVLLVPDAIREPLARFLRPAHSGLHVLAYGELPDNKRLRIVASVDAAEHG